MEWISKSEEAKFKRMFPKVDVEQGTILKMNIRENITLPIVNELSHARKFLNKKGELKVTQEYGNHLDIKARS